MVKLSNKATVEQYQDNLEAVKEAGTTDKPIQDPKPGRGKISNIKAEVKRPIYSDDYRMPIYDIDGTQFGQSKYDTDLVTPMSFYDESGENQKDIFEREVMENRAQEQPKGEKLLAGLGRAVAKTGTEFGKGLGYLGGGVAAIFTQDIDDIVNNAFVQTFEKLDEATKEAMPVYIRREIENGTLARQLWSPEFWATEGADAVGFMASSILSGGAIGAATKGIGVTNGLANLGRFVKLTKGGQKATNAVDNFVMTMGQSYIESFAETDGAIQDFDAHWNQYRQEDGTYNVNGEIYNEKQVQALRGELGFNTFAMNMVATAGPNYFTTKAIFGTGGSTKNIFNELDIDTSSLTAMKEGLKNAVTRKQIMGDVLKEGGKGAGFEAFQEISQFAIQEYEGAKSKMQTDDDLVNGLIDGYIEGFTSIEGQKAALLGGILGLGPGLKKGFKERKSRLERARGLTKMMEENIIDLKDTLESYYVKNEDGSLKRNANDDGFVVDINRIMTELENGEKEMNDAFLLNYAKSKGMTHAAKSIISRKMIEKALPYFQIEGGEQIFKEHFKDLTEVIETDGKLLGFSSKEAYTKYLDNVITEAKKEYDNIKNIGPRYFGIDISEYQEQVGKRESQVALQNFYGQMEAQGALWGALINLNKTELKSINDKIFEIETYVKEAYTAKNLDSKDILVDIEDMFKYAPDNVKQKKEHSILLANKKYIEENLKEINKKYKDIFDKKQQQKAFQNFVKKEEDKKDTQEIYEKEAVKDREFADEFYSNLAEKGYGDIKESFNSNKVRLRDNTGKIYAIKKEFDIESGKSKYYVMPVNEVGVPITTRRQPLTKEVLQKLGIADKDAIMEPTQFEEWKKQQKIVVMNQLRIDRLNDLMNTYTVRKTSVAESIDKQLEKLKEVEETLNYWKTQEEIPLQDIINEIRDIEETYNNINAEIESLQQYTELLNDNLRTLNYLKSEIHTAIEENVQYSFNLKLQKLKQEFQENKFSNDEELINLTLNEMRSQIEDLTALSINIEDALGDMYDAIIENKNFSDIIKSMNDDTSIDLRPILKWLNANYEGVADTDKLDFRQLKDILNDPNKRSELLRLINNSRAELWNFYNLDKTKLQDIKDSLKKLNKEYGKTLDNKIVLKRNVLIKNNIKQLILNNKIAQELEFEKDIIKNKYNQNSLSERRIEQEGDSSKEGPKIKKRTPFTTITNIYEDTDNTKIHTNPIKFSQSSNWARAMSDIDLSELGIYSTKIVNNRQLAEAGIIPPSDQTDDLYAILYKNGNPYIGDNGKPVYTGIAHINTYFPEGKEPTIDVTHEYSYVNAVYQNEKEPITKEKPYMMNNVPYESLIDVQRKLEDDLKKEYTDWRKGLLDKVNNNETVFTTVTNVSKGHPISYTDERNNPKEVFKVKKLHVGREFIIKVNGEKESVENGKIYVELDNGQVQRVLNKTIGSLPENERIQYINSIIRFMALANEIDGKDYKQGFKFKPTAKEVAEGAKPSRMPLFGNSSKPGILDTFISWNTKNPDWNISLVTKKSNNEKTFVINIRGQKIWLPAKSLLDAKGNPKNINDSTLAPLVQFLDSKYLNVVEGHLNKGIRIPTGWSKNKIGEVEISYKPYKNYNDYVLDNYLYTEIKEPTDSDKLPTFVNQYAVLGTSVNDAPSRKKPAEKAPQKNYIIVDNTVPTEKPATSESPKMDNSIEDNDPAFAMLMKSVHQEGPSSTSDGNFDAFEALMKSVHSTEKEPVKVEPEEETKEHCQTATPFDKKNNNRGKKII